MPWQRPTWAAVRQHRHPLRSQPPLEDLARGKPTIASSQWSEEFSAAKADDGNLSTRWNAAEGKAAGEWLEIDLGRPTRFQRTVIRQFGERITRYKIQYWNGNRNQWREAFTGPMGAVQRDRFPAVIGSKVSLLVQETKGGQTPSIFSLAAFNEESPAERSP
jgi:F5/8 type C domain